MAFPGAGLELRGFLYTPEGPGPFRAVLYNHGSEQRPGWVPQLGRFFSQNGYVFFIPHRRSHGRSPRDRRIDGFYNSGRAGVVPLHEAHLEDQLAALDFLKKLPRVDRGRIAVAGCSYGGIQTLLAAEASADPKTGLRAAVDFAGGAMTWQHVPELRTRMLAAARKAGIPVMFVQAENDYDLTPSHALAKAMDKAGKPHRLSIYPPYGDSVRDGHGFCVRGSAVWGRDVLSFLEAHLKH